MPERECDRIQPTTNNEISHCSVYKTCQLLPPPAIIFSMEALRLQLKVGIDKNLHLIIFKSKSIELTGSIQSKLGFYH